MSERHNRVVSLIHELVATFIRNEANADPMITVTAITLSPDYRQATIHFTTIPEGREQDALVFLKRGASELRHTIMKKSDLKIIPFLSFAIDLGERHRQHIDTLTNEIYKNDEQ